MDITVILFYQPLFNLLIVLYHLFGNDLGLAIIGIAVLSRIITFPLTTRQIKMAETSQEFNAKYKEVQKKHKKDKEKQTQELMKLQSEYLPGQLSGCLTTIIQFVLLINILNVIRNLFDVTGAGISKFNEVAYPVVGQLPTDQVINSHFLGFIDLSRTASSFGDSFVQMLPYLVLAVLVGVTQYSSTKILMGMRNKPKAEEAKKDKKNKKKAGEEPEDFSAVLQRSTRQTMMIFPVLAVFFALNFPAGLSLYWTVQSGLVIIQQLLVDRFNRNSK